LLRAGGESWEGTRERYFFLLFCLPIIPSCEIIENWVRVGRVNGMDRGAFRTRNPGGCRERWKFDCAVIVDLWLLEIVKVNKKIPLICSTERFIGSAVFHKHRGTPLLEGRT